MVYVLAATWTAKPGEEERVQRALVALSKATRQEPGCLFYQVHRGIENRREFFIYEQYTDPAAFEAHAASAHFEQYGRGEAIPLLESRARVFYETVEGGE